MQQGTCLSAGRPWPLGVTLEGDGANVAVVSEHAERIELCLFDAQGRHETARLTLPERTHGVFHGHVDRLAAGQVYGLRAHGPWAPGRGHRFNPHRLLLDPYARALTGRFLWQGPNLVDEADPFAFDPRDSAPFVPKCVVTGPAPAADTAIQPDGALSAPAAGGARPEVPWDRTVIYELHLKGMTRLHPAVPEGLRGTYQGLAHPAVLEHLVKLGVTTVELMPVTAFLDERRLVERGLVNYWGYNPFAFFVPEPRYAIADPAAEFRAMIAALHDAGLEIVMDVVFNHTAETDELGPTLSFRGLDNALYYRLRSDDRRLYINDTGCGNTLDLTQPRVLQLVMDALRHWAAMGVDGFRFDLAPVLGRGRDGRFDADAPLLQAIRQDPVLGRCKLIAEPWDIGPGGYQAGAFPPPFAEWNDGFRDCVRRFWRGDEGVLPELASRLLGSADRFERNGRKSFASINFVAAHDGFTLADSVTYGRRHNDANGEGNRDGHAHEISANHGREGPTDDATIRAIRIRQVRNHLATLFFAQGTPMLAMGDEVLRSQAGNNNAYCQDNPTSWFPWDRLPAEAEALAAFLHQLAELRRSYPVLRQRAFLHGRRRDAEAIPDVVWLTSQGTPMTAADWHDPANRRLALLLNGRAACASDALLLLLNADREPASFVLPRVAGGTGFVPVLSSAETPPHSSAAPPGAGQTLGDREFVLYRMLSDRFI